MVNRVHKEPDCGFPDFSRTKSLPFPDFSMHFVHETKTLQKWLLNAEMFYAMYFSILNTKLDLNF